MHLLAPEAVRLLELQSYGLLDSPREAELDRLVELSARVLQAPIALLSLVDRDRQFFLARTGLEATSTPRTGSFCSHAIQGDEVFTVSDARSDARFAAHPLVVGAPGLRFYAGAPLVTRRRAALGTLCILDTRPRVLSTPDKETLAKLGTQMMSLLDQRRSATVHGWLSGALGTELRAAVDEIRRSAGSALSGGTLAAGEAKRMVGVLAGVERLDALLDTVTELTRLGLGEPLQLSRTRVDLRALCREALDELAAALGVEFTFEADGDCTGLWDPEHLSRLALLLFEEARERSPRRALVRVSARAAGDDVLLEVRIPAPAREPGSRIHLARELTQAQGGRIEFHRLAGQSLFVVRLPRTPPS